MMVLVTYDVSTTTKAGRRRLHLVAKACLDYGQRAQNSVFECQVDPARFAELRHRLLALIEPAQDSLRFYFLGKNWQRRVEHYGIETSTGLDEPLIV
ncbi:MAG: CRISPR-associated endoribonuclease Cas2 [Phycisphaerae bacterium]|nr:CRISPR-associated endoribonuclease Cas2 [Phycisphaerae bacterium]